ncbi:MAG: hypothetical protein ACLR8P_12800 [Clostridium fessum]
MPQVMAMDLVTIRTFIYFVWEKRKPGISVGIAVSLYLESDPGIISFFHRAKADAFLSGWRY